MPWWEWVTYAKDPVARDLLTGVLARLNTLTLMLPPPPDGYGFVELPKTRPLDCGHTHHAYAIYRDGHTTCYTCYRPTRGNAHGSI